MEETEEQQCAQVTACALPSIDPPDFHSNWMRNTPTV